MPNRIGFERLDAREEAFHRHIDYGFSLMASGDDSVEYQQREEPTIEDEFIHEIIKPAYMPQHRTPSRGGLQV